MVARRIPSLHSLAIRTTLYGALATSAVMTVQRLLLNGGTSAPGGSGLAADLAWMVATILLLAASLYQLRSRTTTARPLPRLGTVLILFAVLSLALFAIGAGAYVMQVKDERRQAHRLLSSQADERIDQMRGWMALLQRESQARQTDPLLLEVMQRWQRTGLAEDRERLRAWLDDQQRAQGLDNLALIGLSERPLIAAHAHDLPPGWEDAVARTLASGEITFVSLHHHQHDPSIAWVTPIQVREPGRARTVGLLLSEVNGRAMLREALDTDRVEPWQPEVHVLEVGEHGRMQSIVSDEAPADPVEWDLVKGLANRGELERGSNLVAMRHGERLLLHARRMPILGWVVVAACPESQVLHHLRVRWAVLGVVLFITLFAGLLVTVELWRRQRQQHLREVQAHDWALMESERRRQESEIQLEDYTRHEPLANLPGRAALRRELGAGLARANRTRGEGALMVIGLDRLSAMHDSLGETFSDEILVASSQRIGSVLRSGDYLARLGVGEFAVILENLADLDEAARLCRILIGTLSEPFPIAGDRRARITASIGVAPFAHGPTDGLDLTTQACAALHQAQIEGGAKYCFHRPEQTSAARRRLELEMRLYQAQAEQELDLHYQPLVDLGTGQVRGVEALLRWTPRGGVPISPAEFVPVAEQSGLIEPIGDWVLMRACSDMARWRRAGHDALRTLAVNLSPRQLMLPDIERRITAALDASGLEPHVLELEITESALIGNFDDIVQTLHRLKSTGIRIAVDDFGTGYSSMSYLKRFPLDKIKIDRSFVGDLPRDDVDGQIVTAIAALGRALELEVLAEGVESAPQAAFLMGIGCRTAQGYLFSRPLPEAELLQWLARQT